MTIPSTARKAGPLLGTGVQTAWPFTFKVFAAADVAVTIANSAGTETPLVLGTDYSVTLNVNQDTSPGGTVTYPISGTPLAVGSKLSIVGDIDYDQPLDLPSGGNFSPLALENELDRVVMQIQQLREVSERAVVVPVTSDADGTLPAPEAQKILGWDVNGTGLQNYDIPDLFSGAVYADWVADTFAGNGTQTLFVLQRAPGAVGNCDVSVDGQTYVPNVDFSLSGAALTFTVAPIAGAEILVRYGSAATQVSSTFSTESQTATAGQTIFFLNNLLYNPGANSLAVYVNGLRMVSGVDFLETDIDDVTFTSGLTLGDEVLFIAGRTINESIGAEAVSYLPGGTGAVATTAQSKLRESVSVFDYMTPAQISAVQSYAYAVDMTTALQNAINQAFALQADLYVPAGGYLVTGLYLPGRVSGVTDDRGRAFRLFGQGTGEPFVVSAPNGTVIRSVTNAPVLQDYADGATDSNGQVTVDHIRFDGTSTTPVVLLQSFYGLSVICDCVVYQRGTGDGLRLGWGATVKVDHCYVMNKDWATFGLGAARVGTGIAYIPTADNGLVTISKCTSRGWLTAYQIAGGAGTAYSACIDKCEGSVIYNGVILQSNADKCVVSNSYFEGGDGGIGINNLGDYNTIRDNLFFAGFATVVQDLSTSNKGTLIDGNLIAIGASGKGIDVASSAAFGGYNKNITNNSITYTAGTSGVKGIAISGTDPRVNVLGNSFDPRGAWTGAGSTKIQDNSTGGITGLVTGQTGDFESAFLSNSAIALRKGSSSLTESNVTADNLTVPEGVSYFTCAATLATNVQRFTAGQTSGRLVTFLTTNANMTFQDTAYNQLAGGASFAGPGTITFLIDLIGADNYAYEIARTVF